MNKKIKTQLNLIMDTYNEQMPTYIHFGTLQEKWNSEKMISNN